MPLWLREQPLASKPDATQFWLLPYFDHNATTPLAPAAREAWLRAADEAWQNPSSAHRAGVRVKLRLDAARARLAELIDSDPKRLVFTGGATEAAAGILAHLARTIEPSAVLAISPTEHPCVLDPARAHFGEARLRFLPVPRSGVVTPAALTETLQRAAADGSPIGAVVIMAANNETGVLQPWTELAAVARGAGVPLVCDASQWLGKLAAGRFGEVDWVFGAAHKFGGPKGVGFLQRPLAADDFVLRAGTQEQGRRAGTEDYAGVAAMVAALRHAEQTQVFQETERLRWREQFERDVTASLPGSAVIGAEAERLWNTVLLLLPHGENTRWLARLDQRGFEVSTGSACATGHAGPSHVLAALGYRPDEARRVVRLSAGWATTPEDWEALRAALVAVAEEVKPATAVVSG
jgi:cysteine desulfurase